MWEAEIDRGLMVTAIAFLVLCAWDIGLFFIMPHGIVWDMGYQCNTEYDFLSAGCGNSQGGHAKLPSYSIALHEQMHVQGFGEDVAYTVTAMQLGAYGFVGLLLSMFLMWVGDRFEG